MSYSFQLPEEEPICECRWDEVRQCMDRDDCHFHFDLTQDSAEVKEIEPDSAKSHQVDTPNVGKQGPAKAIRNRSDCHLAGRGLSGAG